MSFKSSIKDGYSKAIFLEKHDKSKSMAEYVEINGKEYLKAIAPWTRCEIEQIRSRFNQIQFKGFAI